jgi:glycerol uptake facilitator-like aquaporin
MGISVFTFVFYFVVQMAGAICGALLAEVANQF